MMFVAPFALSILFAFAQYGAPQLLNSSNLVISLAVDLASDEICREAVRLLKSIKLFGGEMSNSRIHVCVSYDDSVNDIRESVSFLSAFEYTSISFSRRFSFPDQAPTLNKLCSMEPPNLTSDDYILYLDADIFVASDPLPLLNGYLIDSYNTDMENNGYFPSQHRIYCGRPWNTFPEIDNFFEFVAALPTKECAKPRDDPYLVYLQNGGNDDVNADDFMETLAGGRTFSNMCNTGMYFMSIDTARELMIRTREYLAYIIQSELEQSKNIEGTAWSGVGTFPYVTSYVGIDSLVMWAAAAHSHVCRTRRQQYNEPFSILSEGMETKIVSPLLNYIAAAERFVIRFLDGDEERIEGTNSPSGFVPASAKELPVPSLIHFSRGSDLFFKSNTEVCWLLVTILEPVDQKSLIINAFETSGLSSPTQELCRLFLDASPQDILDDNSVLHHYEEMAADDSEHRIEVEFHKEQDALNVSVDSDSLSGNQNHMVCDEIFPYLTLVGYESDVFEKNPLHSFINSQSHLMDQNAKFSTFISPSSSELSGLHGTMKYESNTDYEHVHTASSSNDTLYWYHFPLQLKCHTSSVKLVYNNAYVAHLVVHGQRMYVPMHRVSRERKNETDENIAPLYFDYIVDTHVYFQARGSVAGAKTSVTIDIAREPSSEENPQTFVFHRYVWSVNLIPYSVNLWSMP